MRRSVANDKDNFIIVIFMTSIIINERHRNSQSVQLVTTTLLSPRSSPKVKQFGFKTTLKCEKKYFAVQLKSK